MPKDELRILIRDLEKDMKDAAARLDFERAAELRDMLFELKALDEMLKNVKTKDKKVKAEELFKQAEVK